MKSELEMDDREWRQMRRQLSKLDFEPVPETPALVPRSLYADEDKCAELLNSECSGSKRDSSPSLSDNGPSSNLASPKYRSTVQVVNPDYPKEPIPRLEDSAHKMYELSSTSSVAVPPLVSNRYYSRESKLSDKIGLALKDTELAMLEAQMSAAQEATRGSVMGAFAEYLANLQKNEELQRKKLLAAHTTETTSLRVD